MSLDELKEKYKDVIPVPIVKIASDVGLDIYETDEFHDNLSGSLKKEGDKFVIYVNAKQSPKRKRFTIAHEIAHYFLHKDKIGTEHVDNVKQPAPELHREDGVVMTQEQRHLEQEANELAADLLMPRDAFLREWEKATDVSEVAHAFKVSTSAATVRALKLANSYTT